MKHKCQKCNGSGQVFVTAPALEPEEAVVLAAIGADIGWMSRETCPNCQGKGWIKGDPIKEVVKHQVRPYPRSPYLERKEMRRKLFNENSHKKLITCVACDGSGYS